MSELPQEPDTRRPDQDQLDAMEAEGGIAPQVSGEDDTNTFHLPSYAEEVKADSEAEYGGGIGPVGGVITRSQENEPGSTEPDNDATRDPGMGPGSRE